MTIQSYQGTTLPRPLGRFYPEDDTRTRASYDSLAYSDITGEAGTLMTTVSEESRRLNGYTPTKTSQHKQAGRQLEPQSSKRRNYYQPTDARDPSDHYREDWIQQPRIRACFLISVVLSVCTVFLLTSGAIDSEWLENIWEMGLKGARAQGIADASLIKTSTGSSARVVNNNIDQPEENDTVLLGASKKKTKTNTNSVEDAATATTAVEVPSSPPNGCESTIMLIRHCEKGNLRSHCNYNGFERAAYLATLFGDDKKERWPAPSSIYALKTGGRGHRKHTSNFREVETVQYIADKHQLDVNEQYTTSNHKHLANDLLESVMNGDQCGKLTVIAWKHSDLPRLAQLLGKCSSKRLGRDGSGTIGPSF